MTIQLLVLANWQRGNKYIPAQRLRDLIFNATDYSVEKSDGSDEKFQEEEPIISRVTTGRLPLYGKVVDEMIDNDASFLQNGFALADEAEKFVKEFEPDEKEWLPMKVEA